MFFGISRTEANGMVFLMAIMILMIISPLIYRHIGNQGYSAYKQDIKLLDSLVKQWENTEKESGRDNVNQSNKINSLFHFNPNTVRYPDMILLGIDSVIAARIVKYRNKGGFFYTKKDVLKIYGFPDLLYHDLEEYIDIPEQTRPAGERKKSAGVADIPTSEIQRYDNLDKHFYININMADTVQLKKIRGIGSVLSSRIVKYRNMLGGFTNVKQLDEIYGLKGKSLLSLKQSVYIDSSYVPAKIRINFAGWAEFVHHPYIDGNLANILINIREKHGAFKSPEELKVATGMNDSIFNRIIPYFEF